MEYKKLVYHIDRIAEGYSEGLYHGKKFGIVKSVFNNGKSSKVYAKELGGNNFISLNYYITKNNHKLKPCEMSDEKVINFLRHVILK
ncbi:peptide methionine sulfoxide reductase [Pareuzebyella sediminis]|uniref:peptide methionine sulfoxide reductase n=1 Tax=Pareuzebyella sediminis TaxID=2607998 RepID=UPI0011ED51D8|nr:peptide methionine sulfoxide reductase [Pareuzebyella sediminis]